MKFIKLLRMVRQNIRRNLSHLGLSAIGVIVGIAAFSFFLSLGVGVKTWVHSDNFLPLTKLEIIPPKKSLEEDPSKLKTPLTDAVVAEIRARPEVREAYPKMKFSFPGLGHGGKSVFGHNIHIEFLGDGIDPNLVRDQSKFSCGGKHDKCTFRDFWAEEQPRRRCRTAGDCPKGMPCLKSTRSCAQCAADEECGTGNICDPFTRMCIPELKCWPDDPLVRDQAGVVVMDEFDRPLRKKKEKNADCWQVTGRFRCDYESSRCTPHCKYHDDCGPGYYCDKELTRTCYRAIPALVSQFIIEIYNGSVAPGRGWTKIDRDTIDQFLGMTFTTRLGESVIGAEKAEIRELERRVQLIGVSDKAIKVGVTVPIGYVKRWNRYFARQSADGAALEKHKYKHYTSVVVWLKNKAQVHRFTTYIKQSGFELEDNQAETVGLLITIVTILLTIVSVFIVLISAINISHTYYMLISERRREIGVLRAVGASRWDIRRIILSEAFFLGLLSGGAGLGVGFILSWVVDFINTKWVPYFPFKPDSYFEYTWWLCALAIAFAVIFCLAGAFLPANRAARMEPASALTAQ